MVQGDNIVGILVLTKPRIPDGLLLSHNTINQRMICNFAGVEGECWVDAPLPILGQLVGEVYPGDDHKLRAYISSLVQQNYLVSVLKCRQVSSGDQRSCVTPPRQQPLGYDIAFTTDHPGWQSIDRHFYSIILNSLGANGILAERIAASLNERGLIATAADACELLELLKTTRSAPEWLEPSYLSDPQSRVVTFEILDVLGGTSEVPSMAPTKLTR